MKYTHLVNMLFVAALTAGCGNSNGTDPILVDPINTDYQGVWVAEDKALVMHVERNSVTNYRFTNDYCVMVDREDNADTADLQSLVDLSNDGNSMVWFAGYGSRELRAPGFTLEKQNGLPLSCINNQVALDGQPGYQRNPELTFDMFVQIFQEYYMDFELNNVDWLGLAQEQSATINANSSDLDLIIAMDNMLEPLADSHNSVTSPDGIVVAYNKKLVLYQRLIKEYAQQNNLAFPIDVSLIDEQQALKINAYVDDGLALQRQLIYDYAESEEDIKFRADGDVFWFKNEGIGFLFIGKMYEYHADNEQASDLQNDAAEIAAIDAILDEALSDLSNVQGLIVDVRTNNGGHDFVSLAIASRFTDTKVLAYLKQEGRASNAPVSHQVYIEPRGQQRFTGPIALLVSASSVSATEVFSLAMAELDNVVLIGEATQGAFSDIMDWPLPNGFELGLSSEFYFDARGIWLEGQGVPVDIETEFFTIENREQEIDEGIETAIQALLND